MGGCQNYNLNYFELQIILNYWKYSINLPEQRETD